MQTNMHESISQKHASATTTKSLAQNHTNLNSTSDIFGYLTASHT